jgi:hypothetical protein
MNQISSAGGSRDGSRTQYGLVCVLIAFSHLRSRIRTDVSCPA